MSVFAQTTRIKGYGLNLVQYGYAESPEVALLMYDMKDLNKQDLDFKSLSPKHISSKATITETGESIERAEEDLKDALVNVNTFTSATSIVVDTANIAIGEMLYNQTKGGKEVMVVGVSGSTLTLAAPGLVGGAVNDKLIRSSFAKQYGVDHALRDTRNNLTTLTNNIQFTEHAIDSDLIDNNKTLLWMTQEEKDKARYGDVSRNIIKGIISGFYTGARLKTNASGQFQYSAGGLEEYIPVGNRVNIKGADNTATKRNFRTQIQRAMQCGLSGVQQKNKLLWFCTTSFVNDIHDLYDSQLTFNDEITAINMNIKTYNVSGYNCHMVPSNLLDYHMSGMSIAYSVPVDYTFLYMLPRTTLDATGKSVKLLGKGIVYQKPQTTIEKATTACATNYSFMFQGMNSGGYRRLIIA